MERNNVRAEMARFGLTISEMAQMMEMAPGTLSQKLNGKKDWLFAEVVKVETILNSYGANVEWRLLFEDTYDKVKEEYKLMLVGKTIV